MVVSQNVRRCANDTRTKMSQDPRWRNSVIKLVGFRKFSIDDRPLVDYTAFLGQLEAPVRMASPTSEASSISTVPTVVVVPQVVPASSAPAEELAGGGEGVAVKNKDSELQQLIDDA